MTFFKSLIIEASFWQSSLFIFLLSLLAVIIGYVIKYYLDIKKSKRIKILSLELIVGAMYTNGSFVIPSLSLIIENLSKTDVIINYVRLKCKDDHGMAPISMGYVQLSVSSFKNLLSK
ncbi:hypothetical protein [Planktosalinus lacus]|uniref:Uncharacterized protein n=1 Tax=Planktosalinus lacus TaxID=1526573 RepID=A0A8J2V9T7_9FLAO|nr:hypothetical protein [Planktosalinus lacus]GGD93705.1 hypothetical protein GCM10011312_16800 [Planktosalinus lacus]